MTFQVVDQDRVTVEVRPATNRYYGVNVARVLPEGDSLAAVQAYLDGASTPGAVIEDTKVMLKNPVVAVGATVALRFVFTTSQGAVDEATIYLLGVGH